MTIESGLPMRRVSIAGCLFEVLRLQRGYSLSCWMLEPPEVEQSLVVASPV